jgi:DNA-nicking Smr family endonuclease
MSRRRSLTPNELTLWRHVTRSVRPLPGKELPAEPLEPVEAPLPAPAPARPVAAAPAPVPATLPPLVPLDRRAARAVRRERIAIDAVIDLHGDTQATAHGRLRDFLHRQQARGARHVLVVTGKGAAAAYESDLMHGQERGVLRRMVPHWLRLPDLRPLVLGFEEAAHRQGGAGALLVRLRRGRDP